MNPNNEAQRTERKARRKLRGEFHGKSGPKLLLWEVSRTERSGRKK